MNSIESFLGNHIVSEYQELMPVIRLIIYCMDYSGKVELDKTYTNKKNLFRQVVYCKNYLFRKRACGGVYISEEMFTLERIFPLIENLAETTMILGGGTIFNQGLRRIGVIEEKYKNIETIRRNSRTLFWGRSVAGKEVSNVCCGLYDLFTEICEKRKSCEDYYEEVEILLCALKNAYSKRIQMIMKKLSNRKITRFITTNQYNLDDIMLLMACHKLGIRTEELCHHSYFNLPVDYYKDMAIKGSVNHEDSYFVENENPFFAVDESGQWSEADIRFVRKYVGEKNIWGENIHFKTVGCLEITDKIESAMRTKYVRKHTVTFFVPAYTTYTGFVSDETQLKGKMDFVISSRAEYFNCIEAFAKRNGMQVLLRYHPAEPIEFVNREKELYPSFRFLSNSREDFFRAIFESKLVLGLNSSTLIVAEACGCEAWCFVDSNHSYDFCGSGMKQIKLDDLKTLTLENGTVSEIGPAKVEQIIG